MVLNSCGHETTGWCQLYAIDPDFATTYQLLGEATIVVDFHLHDGLLCHLGHLYVSSRKCVNMIWKFHYNRVVGHFSVEKTVAVLQKYFYWPKLRQDGYIRSCTTYTINKLAIKKQWMYTPLSTPTMPWESISMDYMYGLPSTEHGNDFVFVVCNRFSKMVILTSCKKTITAKPMTKLFFKCVWVHFELPQAIVSDQDSRFLNTFWPLSITCCLYWQQKKKEWEQFFQEREWDYFLSK